MPSRRAISACDRLRRRSERTSAASAAAVGGRPRCAVEARSLEAPAHALSQQVPLEFGEDDEHAGDSARVSKVWRTCKRLGQTIRAESSGGSRRYAPLSPVDELAGSVSTTTSPPGNSRGAPANRTSSPRSSSRAYATNARWASLSDARRPNASKWM